MIGAPNYDKRCAPLLNIAYVIAMFIDVGGCFLLACVPAALLHVNYCLLSDMAFIRLYNAG